MPFRRAGFALTPPTVLVFAISLILALIAILAHYGVVQIAMITSARTFLMLTVAYVLLALGVLLRRM
ncbi:hypothetical protein [Rhodoplanes roseus]|uniref:Uncharacterized protein n=1 Tax=Rhodoplanes roseus TaxID=29409 RepID=A0A327L1V3_9BRAD|nr:hypothetical protein [Rhodoplanes roseus]RAI44224.1 hypothetical protein CH341_10215 [Rhodoplanes roseus]